MKAGLLIQYKCLGCHLEYYVEFIHDGKNDYFCPHCGKKKMNIGRYLAKNVEFELEEQGAWEVSSQKLYDLIDYLSEKYPGGVGEDIFYYFEEALLHEKRLDDIPTYEDSRLKTLMTETYDELINPKKKKS